MQERPPLEMSDLEAAWERVRENEGCAGVDGVTLVHYAQKLERELGEMLDEVRGGVYRPLPLLRIVIEKTPGSRKTRTLLVPGVRDRVLQTAVARQMSRSYEEEFLEVSFAYRPGRGVDRAIARLRQLRDLGFEHVLDADIKGFFDSVSFAKLEGQLMGAGEPAWVLSLVSAWLRIPAWDGKRLRYRSRGLPQGSPLSPLLANLFLYPLDTGLSKAESKLVRYADDFLVLAQDREGIEGAREETVRILGELELELNAAKTRITSFSEGFRFLGVYFQKDEIWQPWKEKPKSQGRLLAMAKPMSEAQLRPFRLRQPDNAWTAKFRQAGVRWVGPGKGKRKEEERPVAYLYLTQQGSVLRKSGDRFLVELDDKILLDLPYDKLEHVLLFGQVQVTTQAIGELLEKGVDLSYFSWRGQFRGSLTPPRSTNIQDRLAQLDLWRNAAKSLELAQRVVTGKLENQAAVLRQIAPGLRPGELPDPAVAVAAARRAATINELMGVEGAAARAYFAHFGQQLPSPFSWQGRQPRPARDPVNALLNLTYTLLTQELASLAEAEGLEVALGALHQLDRGRPSLALDLVEVFRAPVADRFVLALLRQHHLGVEDFLEPEGGGVVLSPPALRRYLGAYENWMLAESRQGEVKRPSYRNLLRAEVRKYLAMLRGAGDFEPYLFSSREEARACDISSVTI